MRVMRKSSRSQIDRLTPLHCALAGGRVRRGRPEPMLNLQRIPGASQVWFFNVFRERQADFCRARCSVCFMSAYAGPSVWVGEAGWSSGYYVLFIWRFVPVSMISMCIITILLGKWGKAARPHLKVIAQSSESHRLARTSCLASAFVISTYFPVHVLYIFVCAFLTSLCLHLLCVCFLPISLPCLYRVTPIGQCEILHAERDHVCRV